MKTIIVALALGTIAWFLPEVALEAVARTLVLAVALMAAGIFPCMTLTVNAMRGEERSPTMVVELYDQLKTLLKVLVVAFILAVASVFLLATTAAMISAEAGAGPIQAAAVCTGVALGLFMSRVVAIGKSFFALLDINRTQALLISRKKVRSKREEAIEYGRQEAFISDDPRPHKLKKVG